ncbi:hypothetical protein [Lignipirellula cremea]|uniref:Knr4/Smi1-like domain-containing protein n=1 Tax=Lignipirellula cremea TaxID=2528010 RepID=A0A518DWM0_9BACT|nr:hypothetical protein [Lignipirellula cremea]QDU96240.1 hypothetical protein Pla8534_40590 [Lignipirellula cremea]
MESDLQYNNDGRKQMSRKAEKADVESIRGLLREYYAAAVEKDCSRLRLDADMVPAAMVDRVENDGSVLWKMLPSTIKPAEIRRLESRLRYPLPPMYRAYLQSYFHLFSALVPVDSTCGQGGVGFASMPCDDPLWTFNGAFEEANVCFGSRLQQRLLKLGFPLIGWSLDDRLALNTHSPDDEGDYQIIAISNALDDEVFDSITGDPLHFELDDVWQHTQPVCESFKEFVNIYFRL